MKPLLIKLFLTGMLSIPVYNELSWIGLLMLWFLVLQEETVALWRDNQAAIVYHIDEIKAETDKKLESTWDHIEECFEDLRSKLD